MKIFLDDVRPAPEGWVLAHDAREAIGLLEHNDVTHISLDFDLGGVMPGYEDAPIERKIFQSMPGSTTGLDVVRWMIENDRIPQNVHIHSWNWHGALMMEKQLRKHGSRPTKKSWMPSDSGLSDELLKPYGLLTADEADSIWPQDTPPWRIVETDSAVLWEDLPD